MKPTVGSVGMDGIFVVSKFFDVAGEMTKSVIDLAHLTEHIFDTDAREKLPKDGYMSVLNTEWTGLRIGFLQPDDWILPPALVEPDETVHAEIVMKRSHWQRAWSLTNTETCYSEHEEHDQCSGC